LDVHVFEHRNSPVRRPPSPSRYRFRLGLPPVHSNVGLSEPELRLELFDVLIYRWRIVEVAMHPEICRNRMTRDADRVPLLRGSNDLRSVTMTTSWLAALQNRKSHPPTPDSGENNGTRDTPEVLTPGGRG